MVDPATEAGAPDQAEVMAQEIVRLRQENERLRSLLGLSENDQVNPRPPPAWKPTLFTAPTAPKDTRASIDRRSPPAEKVAFFMSMFAGRTDVYALRWSSDHTGKSGWSPAVRGGWSNAKRRLQDYLPLTPEVISGHLSGDHHVGLYPLMDGDRCGLLVADFDGDGWALDAKAYRDVAEGIGIPTLLERSRSGDGAHVWTFFTDPVAASSARRVGIHLLREAMTVRAELDLASYDRLFPAQDFVPKGSFGNLIALPLNGTCRRGETTVFLDPTDLRPYEDQWELLASVERLPVSSVVEIAAAVGEVGTGPAGPAYRAPAGPTPPPPAQIAAKTGPMLALDRTGVPPSIVAALKHLASVPNPEYYEKERLRFSTWNVPRLIRCYREELGLLLLPRGLEGKAATIVKDAGSRLTVTDGCSTPDPITIETTVELRAEQARAADVLAANDLGVLVAPPGSGKTVVGCALIARHRQPTLVLVDRKPLAEQWRERLTTHLDLRPKDVGQLGGGRNRSTGIVDIAMLQSLARRDDLAELGDRYGFVIADECHHVPAVNFERVVRQLRIRRRVGLTATPYRRDGLQAIIGMHFGPVRHTMPAPLGTALESRELIVHATNHQADAGDHIQATFRSLVDDTERTATICADIAASAAVGRNCLVLTRWKEHLDLLNRGLDQRGVKPLTLYGGMGKKARKAVIDQLKDCDEGGMVLVATASLLGEGFDCPPLDTLFLAFPVKFKGSVVQYVGRVLRPSESKTRIEVHDYLDVNVPVLARMHDERRKAYTSLGIKVPRRPAGRS